MDGAGGVVVGFFGYGIMSHGRAAGTDVGRASELLEPAHTIKCRLGDRSGRFGCVWL